MAQAKGVHRIGLTEQINFEEASEYADFKEFLQDHYTNFDFEDCWKKFEIWQEEVLAAFPSHLNNLDKK